MTAVRGYDISHYNASADFATAKAAGYRFVYLKATQGTGFKDPMFDGRVVDARRASVPVGAYLFLEPDQPVSDQVAHFIEVAGDLDLIPALDHETRSTRGPAATAAAARAAVTLLERHYGEPPVLYCDRSFITEGLTEGLGRCPLWIADYSGGIAGVGRHAGANATARAAREGKHVARAGTRPHIPAGPWTSYAIWQTGQAQVPGVAGGDGPGTDVNVAPDLAAITRHSKPTPNPTPAPRPAPSEAPMLIVRAKGRIAAVVDDAAIGHPISSAKWSSLNHAADKGASVEIITYDDPADWDALIPAAAGKKVDHTEYDAFTLNGKAVPDRHTRAVYTSIVNNTGGNP